MNSTSSGSRLVRTETDRNFDGSVDAVYEYSADGLVSSESADDDFDGRMETIVTYRNGQPVEMRTDFDGDGTSTTWRSIGSASWNPTTI